MEEEGGNHLYAICQNDQLNQFDYLGWFDIYTHSDGWGHVGIADDQGANYDYGRYRGTYSWLYGGLLGTGPNILVKSNGWPPRGISHSFIVFHFDVCPSLDKKVRDALAEELAKGQTMWPEDVLKRYRTPPSPLSNSERYMGSDWSLSDNCVTFTFHAIASAIRKAANEPSLTQREKDEALVLLDLVEGSVVRFRPSSINSMLEQADSKYEWIQRQFTGGNNANSAKSSSCCGSSS
jgi:hypothetical protein